MSAGRFHRSSFSVATPHAWPGARIGIMGGSFNPPHEGHLVVARTALRRLRLDRLWWVVTPGNPLKSNDALPDFAQRKEATRELARDPRMIVTAFETKLGTTYTAATIGFIRTRYPRTQFVWVMGADNLATFHQWQHWKEIASSVPIAVVDRPGWRFKALSSPTARTFARSRRRECQATGLPQSTPPAWIFLTTRLSNQSSTALREEQLGQSVL